MFCAMLFLRCSFVVLDLIALVLSQENDRVVYFYDCFSWL